VEGRCRGHVPVSQFRDRFYRPDVVRLVLETLDETTAVRQADSARSRPSTASVATHAGTPRGDLPALTTIVSARSGNEVSANGRIELEVELRSPSGKAVQQVYVKVNGRTATFSLVGNPQTVSPV
jgi:hypothetical protein